MRRKLIYSSFLLLGGLAAAPAFAQSLTIQGKVLDASNNPVTGTAVQFRVQVKAPDAAKCTLYDETQTLNLSATGGLFSLNLNDGSGTANTPTTYGLEAAISNRADFTVNSSYCASGSGMVTYHPGDGDNRKIIISFYDPGSMSGFEQIPEMDLNPMAFAMESRTVGGYPASSLLRVVTSGAPGTAPTLSATSAAELEALGAGTSAKYTPASATNGAQIPSFSSDPSSPPAGSIWYNSTSGELHYRTSGGTQVVGAGGGGGGTITAITLSGGLTGGGSSGSVGIALPSGSAGQFLKSDGTNWAGAALGFGDLKNATAGSAVGSAVCTAGQTMYYDTTAKELKCQSIGLGNASISGTLAVANGGTGATSTSQNYVFAGPTSGSGAPSFRAITAADLPASASYWTAGSNGINYAGGNVGVGTTAPDATFALVSPDQNGRRELLATFRLSSDPNTMGGFGNGTSANGVFVPSLFGFRAGNVNKQVTSFRGITDATGDFYDTENAIVDISGLVTDNVSDPLNGNLTNPTNRNIFSVSSWNGPMMVVGASGNVGIGSTAPRAALDVNGSLALAYGGNIQMYSSGYANTSILGNYWDGAGDHLYLQPAGNSNSTISFLTAVGSQVSTEKMTILSSGNVGIGSSVPAAKLDVNGTASVGSSIVSASSYVNSGAAYTIPDATVNISRVTLNNNTTITLPAFTAPTGKVWTLTLMVKQDGTGSRTLAFAAPGSDSILWDQSASAPAPQSTASKITIYQFTKPSDETTWYASMVWKQN